MGAKVEWSPYSITITGPKAFGQPLKGIDHDCNDIPDAAMTLAVAALFAQGQTAIRNVYNWRVKETERMKAIVTELGKLGAQVRSVRGVQELGVSGVPTWGRVSTTGGATANLWLCCWFRGTAMSLTAPASTCCLTLLRTPRVLLHHVVLHTLLPRSAHVSSL
jgi:hypothetical protein